MKNPIPRFISTFMLTVSFWLMFNCDAIRAQGWSTFGCDVLGSSTFCPMPAQINARITGAYWTGGSGNTCPDSFRIAVFWGDGQVDSITAECTGTGYLYIDKTISHSYTIPGIFRYKCILYEQSQFYIIGHSPSYYVSPGCVELEGLIYYDNIQNCQFDSTEIGVENNTVTFTDSSGTLVGLGFSSANGEYRMSLPSGIVNGNVKVSEQSMSENCAPNGYSYTTLNDTTINFGVTCNSYFDLFAHHGRSGAAAPGDTGFVAIKSRLDGCNAGSALVKLTVDSQLTIGSQISGPMPDSIVGQSIYWNTAYPFSPSIPRSIPLVVASFKTITDTSAVLLSKVKYVASIESQIIDSNTRNNVNEWTLLVNGPYDPNNKTVSPQGLDDDGKITAEQNELIYTINFQNTGTAPAKNVFILDSLSDNIDLSSIRILETSDSMKTAFYEGGILRFDFENINLPDSSSDPDGSKGWFVFKVRLKKNLPIGTEIKNNVDIFFDYNAPIRTNTTLNTIYNPPIEPEDLSVTISKQDVTCKTSDNGSIHLTIDSGNPPYTITWSNGSSGTYVENLPPAVYSITVVDGASKVFTESIEILENRIYYGPVVNSISGSIQVHSWKPFHYTVPTLGVNTFDWQVQGGEVVQEVANTAEILWHAGPSGKLFVKETDEHGCYGNDSLEVEITYLGVEPLHGSRFEIHPNPTDGMIRLDLINLEGAGKVEILDARGRLVAEKEITDKTTTIDLRSALPGIYFVSITTEEGAEHQRLVVH